MRCLANIWIDVPLGLFTVTLLIVTVLALRYRRAADRSDQRFRRLVESVPEYAIFMLDVRGHVIIWNSGASRITGYNESEILGRHFDCFFPPEEITANKPQEQLEQAAMQGRFADANWRLRKDGTRFWADLALAAIRDHNSQVSGFSIVVRDSTDRKKAQDTLAAAKDQLDRRVQERTAALVASNRLLRDEIQHRAEVEASLRLSEARARGMFETAPDAILTTDARGTINAFNPAAEALFGYAAPDVLGRHISLVMPQAGGLNHHDAREPHFVDRRHNIVGKRKDGSVFPIELSVGRQATPAGEVLTNFVRDVTERQRLEREVLEIAEREQQRFGQDLHDGLGQDLTGIAFLIKVLTSKLRAKNLPEADDAAKVTDLVSGAVSRARSLSHGLQPLDDPAGLPLALERMCKSICEVFHINCRLSLPPGLPLHDFASATHLYRIAQEAVNNAIRHGKATAIDVSLTQDHGRVWLKVADNGGGFPPSPGTGIGVRTMQYRARSIGATLNIEPGPLAGVTVTCSFDASLQQEPVQ